jgi:hypothetical protein
MPSKKINLICLPNSFNLDEHIKQYAPFLPPLEAVKEGLYYSIPKFRKEKAYHFLGLISSIAARNPDIVTEEGFVPINMEKVRNNIKDIKDYINYLLFTGVIECDNHYITGEKSKAYRWAKKYSLSRFSVQLAERSYDNFEEQYAWQYEKYPYLFHWYKQGRLMIDAAATDYAFELYQEKMNDPTRESWEINNEGKKKHPESQYRSAILNIAKMQHKRYEAHIDNNVHRLHSAFTGLGKKYRQFVTYDGQRLVGIDIKNSQPYITSLILNHSCPNIF